jgi:hypothetical protein
LLGADEKATDAVMEKVYNHHKWRLDPNKGQWGSIKPRAPSHLVNKFMMFFTFLFAIAAAAASTNSSIPSPTSTAFNSGVPTDAPIPGDYTGALRPQVHFSPPKNFSEYSPSNHTFLLGSTNSGILYSERSKWSVYICRIYFSYSSNY